MLAQSRLKQILHYNPETGLFNWINNYGTKKAGEIAGNMNNKGYVTICFDGKGYLAHRLAWLYMTGDWPKHQIDHRDRVRNNNCFDNLRDVTGGENSQNNLVIPGLRIYHNRPANRCTAYMKSSANCAVKWVYLGSFANEEEAISKFKEVASTTF